ncbi:MAG: thioredoxin domain-containing protein [Patescibacteria group bacterium]
MEPQQENKLLIPGALVIAGLLIGGAIYFKGDTPVKTPDDLTQPAEIAIEPISLNDHVLGNPNASVVLIEFSDIDCPFCRNFDTTMHQIINEYGASGDVAWVYRHFPLDQLHPDARKKAEATECVAKLGSNEAFWGFLGELFERTDESLADLGALAADTGVDQTAFQSCLDGGEFIDDVVAAGEAALKAGGRGTPYTVLIAPNGEKAVISGAQPYEVVKQAIETALLQTAN